jgi:ParB family chromosome partitioning protein
MGSQAFNAKRTQLFWLDPNEITVIGWDTDDGPEHELYDERAKLPVDEKLASNMAFLGKVLEPISVRKNGDIAETVYGRQRVKAARRANELLKERGAETILVPCQLDRGDDGRLIGMMISENEHRQGETPITRARKLARWMDHGHTEEEAAVLMGGVTVQTVRNTLALLDLDRSVQKMVEDGKLGSTAAGKLAKLSRDEQKVEAKKLVDSGNTTVAAASRATKAARNGGDGGPVAPSKRKLRKLLEAEDGELEPEFVRGIRFCLGDLAPASVKGLTALMDQ